MRAVLIAAFLLLPPAAAFAAGEVTLNAPESGSVSEAEGLEAWGRIYQVLSHPRCANCHTGASDRPMWSGPSYGEARPHGMNVQAGASRIGAETLPCSTCHGPRNSDLRHGPPGFDGDWMLAPVEAHWFGQSSSFICEQMRDPERNGDRTLMEQAEHASHDPLVAWGWNPGPGREKAPFSQQQHTDDLLIWGAAGAPCPE